MHDLGLRRSSRGRPGRRYSPARRTSRIRDAWAARNDGSIGVRDEGRRARRGPRTRRSPSAWRLRLAKPARHGSLPEVAPGAGRHHRGDRGDRRLRAPPAVARRAACRGLSVPDREMPGGRWPSAPNHAPAHCQPSDHPPGGRPSAHAVLNANSCDAGRHHAGTTADQHSPATNSIRQPHTPRQHGQR
jgi:hypothetical protein